MKSVIVFLSVVMLVGFGCDGTGGPTPTDSVTITKLEWQAEDMVGRDTLVIDPPTVSYRGVHVVYGGMKVTDTSFNAAILDSVLAGIKHDDLWARQSNMPDPTISDYWRGELTMTRSSGDTRTITIYQRREKDSKDSLTNRLRSIVYEFWQ